MDEIQNVANTVRETFTQHPYYPLDLQLDAYQEPVYSFWAIMIMFFGFLALYIPGLIFLARRAKHFNGLEAFLFVWFGISGAVHLLVEAPYVLRPGYYKTNNPNIMDDLWKEYGKADSRYAIRESSVVLIEALAAFVEGPLCVLTSYLMYRNNAWWIPTALSASFPELYGTIQYGLASMIDDFKYTRPEAFYFWFYLVFMNQFWFFIPCIAIGHCFNIVVKNQKTMGASSTNGYKGHKKIQ